MCGPFNCAVPENSFNQKAFSAEVSYFFFLRPIHTRYPSLALRYFVDKNSRAEDILFIGPGISLCIIPII